MRVFHSYALKNFLLTEERKAAEEAARRKAESDAATAAQLWSKPAPELEEEKSRDDEFDEFLEDLFM